MPFLLPALPVQPPFPPEQLQGTQERWAASPLSVGRCRPFIRSVARKGERCRARTQAVERGSRKRAEAWRGPNKRIDSGQESRNRRKLRRCYVRYRTYAGFPRAHYLESFALSGVAVGESVFSQSAGRSIQRSSPFGVGLQQVESSRPHSLPATGASGRPITRRTE